MQLVLRRILHQHFILNQGYISTHCRNASLTGAINKGIRKGQREINRYEKGQSQLSESTAIEIESPREDDKPYIKHTRWDNVRRPTIPRHGIRAPSNLPTARRSAFETPRQILPGTRSQFPVPKKQDLTTPPLSTPYTSAESEFLFGTFAIESAIKAKRRKLYKLYVYHGQVSEARLEVVQSDLRRLAGNAGIHVVDIGQGWEGVLSKMTNSRPHNGYVLEASPLPKVVIPNLRRCEGPNLPMIVQNNHSTQTDQKSVEVASFETTLPIRLNRHHYPFMLFLDRIMDPGNFGAILRSAYFLGVDAVIIPEHGTAPLSGVTSKASGGAMEYLPILQIKNEVDFVKTSKVNGWKFFATVADIDSTFTSRKQNHPADMTGTALSSGPCVLMLGNEGEGLRPYIQKLADESVTIPGARGRVEVVESLNVSVAAALFMQEFLSHYNGGSGASSSNQE